MILKKYVERSTAITLSLSRVYLRGKYERRFIHSTGLLQEHLEEKSQVH